MSDIKIKNSRGVSIIFAVLIMVVILNIGLGLSTILIQEIKTMIGFSDSIIALYSADTGAEETLYDLYQSSAPSSTHSGFCGKASFETKVRCATTTGCPFGFEVDPNCEAQNYCLKSLGSYEKTKRVLEVRY